MPDFSLIQATVREIADCVDIHPSDESGDDTDLCLVPRELLARLRTQLNDGVKDANGYERIAIPCRCETFYYDHVVMLPSGEAGVVLADGRQVTIKELGELHDSGAEPPEGISPAQLFEAGRFYGTD